MSRMSPLLLLLLLVIIQALNTDAAAKTKVKGKWSQELGRWMLLPEASPWPAIYENPDALSWRDAVKMCEENHAKPFVPGQPSEWFWLVKIARTLKGSSMWLPMSDNVTEDVLTTWIGHDGSDLPIKWLRDEPMIHNNGIRNCVLLSAEWGYRAIMAPCNDRHAAMICIAQEERCCMAGPPETEAFIAKAGTKEVADFMEQGKINMYTSFKNILSKSISEFKNSFTSSFILSHGELFSDLESQLEKYYMFGHENLKVDLHQDLRDIYQGVFTYQQEGDESYKDCIGKAMDEYNIFKDIEDFSFGLVESMVVMRTLTKGFNTGEQAMKGILKASPPNRACWKEFPKMIQCLRCGLPMKTLPCRGYCEQVTNLCFRHTLPLVPVWYDFIDGMEKLIDSLEFTEDHPNGLFDHHFKEIMSFINKVINKGISQCGHSELPNALQSASISSDEESDESSSEEDEDEDNQEDDEDDEEDDEDEESSEENDNNSIGLQHLLVDYKIKLLWYREFWANLPSEMCRENPWAGEGTCRNHSMAQESANSPTPVSDPENPTKMELQIQLINNFNMKIKAALDDQEIVWSAENSPIYEEPVSGWCTAANEAKVDDECILADSTQQVPWEDAIGICQDQNMTQPQLIDLNYISSLNKIQGSSQYWTSGKLSKEKSTKSYNKWVWSSGHILSPEDCPACYNETNEAECLSWSPESGLIPAECSINNYVLCQLPNSETPAFRQVSMPHLPEATTASNQYAWLNDRIVTVPGSAGTKMTWEEASELCLEDEDLRPYVPWSMQEFIEMAKIYKMFKFNSNDDFWIPASVREEGGSISWIQQQGDKRKTSSKPIPDASGFPEGQVYSLLIPDDVYSGSSATLECLWTDTDSIHAVMWFKDDVNFFTYRADRNVTEIATKILGTSIDVGISNGQQITLVNTTSDSSGKYRCEVMLDEPSYSMTYMEGNLLVTENVLWWNDYPPFRWTSDEYQCIAYSAGAVFYSCEEELLPMICEYTGDDHHIIQQAEKPGPVSYVKADKVTATTITWDIMDPMSDGGRPIEGFKMEYILSDSTWDEAQSQFWTKGSEYTVERLVPDSTYYFRFQARNEVGYGQAAGDTLAAQIMPKRAAPEEPLIEPLIFDLDEGTTYQSPYPNQYTLQWQTPIDNGEPIDNFQIIHYQMKNNSGQLERAEDSAENNVEHPGPTSYQLEDLMPNTIYKIELRARNVIGYSQPAERLIKTATDSLI